MKTGTIVMLFMSPDTCTDLILFTEICDISQGKIKFYTFMEPDYLIDYLVD